jgi:protein-tyrosine phosphatase
MAAAHDLEPLQRAGITHIVDLTVPGFDANEGAPNHRGIEYMHIRVKDQPGENLGQHLKRAGDFIRRAHGAGGGVLVHCLHGKSRSSAVVIAYLLLHHGMTLSGALAFCKKRRSKVAPNIGFVLQLSALEQAASGVSTLDPDVYAADQLWCQVQLGYIQAATGPLKLHHCENQ